MQPIWFLSKERNLMITAFNTVEKNGTKELWITEINNKSRKIATGKEAIDLQNALLDMIWNTSPCLISDSKGHFRSNVNINQDEEMEEEVEE